MVQQPDAQHLGRLPETTRRFDVRIRIKSVPVGMVVCKHHLRGIVAQRLLHGDAAGELRRVHAAGEHARGVEQPVAVVQREQHDRFVLFTDEPRHHAPPDVLGRVQQRPDVVKILDVAVRDLAAQRDQRGHVRRDPRLVDQVGIVGIQHLVQLAEALLQPVAKIVRIAVRQGIKQQQLQHLVLGEAVKAVAQKPLFHPLTVTGMQLPVLFRHGISLSYPKHFAPRITRATTGYSIARSAPDVKP